MAHGTNQPLVLEARKAEALDFRAFYAEHFAFVWRCLRLLGVAESGLDDAAQEVFVIAHRRLPSFRGDSTHRTWLYGIVRNVAANIRRSETRKRRHDALRDDEPDYQSSPHERVEAVSQIKAFLHRLDAKQRDLFVLVVMEQLTIREFSESHGIPLNTAYARLNRLKVEFQRELDRQRVET